MDHYGDCNDDYRDGCEAPTKHPYYCDGDPRIAQDEHIPPSVGMYIKGEGSGPGRFDYRAFASSLGRFRPELEQCYVSVLAKEPGLEAIASYELTLGASGVVSGAKLLRSTVSSPALEGCVTSVLVGVQLDQRPEGGTVTFPYQISFLPGAKDTGVVPRDAR